MRKRTPWQQERRVGAALSALYGQVEAEQAAELARALAQLEHLGEHDREVIRQFGQRMVEQMLEQLADRVRQIAEEAPTDARLDLLIYFLGKLKLRRDRLIGMAQLKRRELPSISCGPLSGQSCPDEGRALHKE